MKNRIAKITAIALALCLSGCSNETQAKGTAREVSIYNNIYDHSEIYYNSDGIRVCDFTTLTDVPLCAKPNCAHRNRDEDCTSKNTGMCPFIYNDKLYFFSENSVRTDSETVVDKTELYAANPDGTDRAVIKEWDLCVRDIATKFIFGDTIYFMASERVFDEYGGFGGDCLEKAILCSYNFDTDEFKEIKHFDYHYCVNLSMYGIFNNCLYFTLSYLNEPLDDNNENIADLFISENYKYDLSGELSPWEDESFVSIRGGLYITQNGNTLTFKGETDEITVETAEEPPFIDTIFNNIAFSPYNGICINLNDGKMYKLGIQGDSSTGFEVKDYIDGKYIVYTIDYTQQTEKYISMDENELITEQIL